MTLKNCLPKFDDPLNRQIYQKSLFYVPRYVINLYYSVVTYVILRTNLGQKEFITCSYAKWNEDSEKNMPQN